MKKIWEDASIETLEITETAGGTVYNTTQDGEVWWDPTAVNPDGSLGRWNTPTGENPNVES